MVGPRGFEPLTFCTPTAHHVAAVGGACRRTPCFTGVRGMSKSAVVPFEAMCPKVCPMTFRAVFVLFHPRAAGVRKCWVLDFGRVDSCVSKDLAEKAGANRTRSVDWYRYQIRRADLLELHVAAVAHAGERPAANIQLFLELPGIELFHTLTCASSAPAGISKEFRPSR